MTDGNDPVRVACVKSNCGTFPMDRALYRKLQRTGNTWTCPAGHAQHFTGSTEQDLRDRIEQLEEKLEQAEGNLDDYEEELWDYIDDLQEERDLRKAVQSALLERIDGVVEVKEETWMWGCRCGGRARSTFESESDAQAARQDHRRGSCDLQNGGAVA